MWFVVCVSGKVAKVLKNVFSQVFWLLWGGLFLFIWVSKVWVFLFFLFLFVLLFRFCLFVAFLFRCWTVFGVVIV